MKKMFLMLGVFFLSLWGTSAYAVFNSGSTGALGNYTSTVSQTIQLPADGMLNYSSVHIRPNTTLTFEKNADNTPVYILAKGDVIIEGTINISGSAGGSWAAATAGQGGPGGFNGGYGGPGTFPGGKGLGPGGGGGGIGTGNSCAYSGGGGGFGKGGENPCSGVSAVLGGGTYGSAALLPIIGGSGGGGAYAQINETGGGGGGGGGAILIASSTSITFGETSKIYADGGDGGHGNGNRYGGGGSGGAVKLVANSIFDNISTTHVFARGANDYANGGAGRIRIETQQGQNFLYAQTDPPYSYGYPPGDEVVLSNQPTLTIDSVAGTGVTDPTGSYSQPDLLLSNDTVNPVDVVVSATNIPDGTQVTVTVYPQYGTPAAENIDTVTLSGSSSVTASVTLSTTYSNVIVAQATYTVITAMNYEGEEIDKVRVASTYGGKSKVTYITKSGREIDGDLLASVMR